jgi:hypothetical protein
LSTQSSGVSGWRRVAGYALTASGGAIPAAGLSLSAPRPLLAEARTRYQELGGDAHHAHATRHLATCQFLCASHKQRPSCCAPARPRRPAPAATGIWPKAWKSLTDQSRRRPPTRAARHPPQRQPYASGTGTQPHRFDRARRTLPCARPRRPERLGPRMASRHPHVVDDVIELSADAGAGSRRG